MCDRISPKRGWCAAGHQVGARELHNAAYCSFRDSVQLVNMWRTSRGVHSVFSEQLRELS
eukprot:2519732-Pleurochrysis_carterae.AAC.1